MNWTLVKQFIQAFRSVNTDSSSGIDSDSDSIGKQRLWEVLNIVDIEELCQIYQDLSEKESSDMWSSEGVLRMLLCVKLREKVFGALEFDFRRG